MICAEFETLILDRLDGQLHPELAVVLDAHLAECESCQAFSAAAAGTDRSIAQFTREPSLPAEFASQVLDKLDRTKPWFPAAVWELAGLGAIAAAGAFCVWHLAPDVVMGGGWLAAAVILCGGVCIGVADTEL